MKTTAGDTVKRPDGRTPKVGDYPRTEQQARNHIEGVDLGLKEMRNARMTEIAYTRMEDCLDKDPRKRSAQKRLENNQDTMDRHAQQRRYRHDD